MIKTIAQLELEAISQAIVECGGDKCEAARLLGIGKTTLYRKLPLLSAAGLTVPPPPPPLPHSHWSSLTLTNLLKSSSTAADYLLRCIGKARKIGEELDKALTEYGNASGKRVERVERGTEK